MKRLLWLIIINLIFVLLIGILTPNFASKANLVVMVDNLSLEAIVLCGYVLLLVGGHFDLSVDGIVALTGVVAGLLMTHGTIWPVAMIIALLLSGLLGAINGLLVSKLGIPAFIATMGTWFGCVGISLGLTKAIAPYGFPAAFQWLGQVRLLGFRSVAIYALVIAVILHCILQYTQIGNHIFATGGNRQAAEMLGVRTTSIGVGLYILVGLLAGFVGLMIASRLNAASPMAVDGMALRVIAAIVIGGGSLTGGKGSIVGGLLGLLLMNVLTNAAIQLGISPYWQKGILGGILLTTVLVEKFRRTES